MPVQPASARRELHTMHVEPASVRKASASVPAPTTPSPRAASMSAGGESASPGGLSCFRASPSPAAASPSPSVSAFRDVAPRSTSVVRARPSLPTPVVHVPVRSPADFWKLQLRRVYEECDPERLARLEAECAADGADVLALYVQACRRAGRDPLQLPDERIEVTTAIGQAIRALEQRLAEPEQPRANSVDEPLVEPPAPRTPCAVLSAVPDAGPGPDWPEASAAPSLPSASERSEHSGDVSGDASDGNACRALAAASPDPPSAQLSALSTVGCSSCADTPPPKGSVASRESSDKSVVARRLHVGASPVAERRPVTSMPSGAPGVPIGIPRTKASWAGTRVPQTRRVQVAALAPPVNAEAPGPGGPEALAVLQPSAEAEAAEGSLAVREEPCAESPLAVPELKPRGGGKKRGGESASLAVSPAKRHKRADDATVPVQAKVATPARATRARRDVNVTPALPSPEPAELWTEEALAAARKPEAVPSGARRQRGQKRERPEKASRRAKAEPKRARGR